MEALGEQPQARPKCPNARKTEIAIIPSCDPTYAPVIQSLCIIAEGFFCEAEGDLRTNSCKTNGRRREPVAMSGVALLRIGGLFCGGPRAAFERGFWTSKGIFVQRWGLNVGFNDASFGGPSALAARRQCRALGEMR